MSFAGRGLYLQPQWRTTAEGGLTLVGAEALSGNPGALADLSADQAFGHDLGILSAAARLLAQWDLLKMVPSDFTISVNFRPSAFARSDIVSQILNAVRRYRLAPHRFVLEILEIARLDGNPTVKRNMAALSEHGFAIAVDDAGSGYHASESDLRRIQIITRNMVTEVKLDRPELGDSRLHTLVASAIPFSGRVVLEFVETLEHLLLLIGLAGALPDHDVCAQGNFLGEKLPAADFTARWLRQYPLSA